ncbi:DUF4437 domain-containing protein [uncultured Paraglaciecola sp.]|uniref:DUF4437 domain-containing protein n=1 Tax=uncultured Paraglaciecola sp. TaxID=1765024 RepID=UPI0030DB0687
MKLIYKAILVATLVVGAVGAYAKDDTLSKVLKEEDKTFIPMMGPVSFADAYGSRETGPHGTFGSFPAHFATPEHTHTHSYRAVVLKGEMTNPFRGETDPPVMIPGSYWAVKAGEKHVTACVSATPCEFLMYSNEGFDFLETEH